jgi:LysM repeat protein
MKQKITIFLFVYFFFAIQSGAQSSGKMTREDYIRAYKDFAVKEMGRSGVPASITLAQGMLESDNGNSRLAVRGNNHFGIKCHNGWKGKRIYHDDDHRNECFRKYNSVFESYEDHSDFLRNGSRYAFLFELDPLDYRSWARGLKKAGYATNPAYAERLIKIIEDNNLHKYDLMAEEVLKADRKRISSSGRPDITREIFKRNRIDYIIVKQGDTFESLQKELGLLPFELFRYNNLSWDSVLYSGRELYIQPKRNKAEAGKSYHIVKQGESLHAISQMYGVKPERILMMNLMSPDAEPVAGQKLSLRKKLRGTGVKTIKPEINPENEKEEDIIQFEFN